MKYKHFAIITLITGIVMLTAMYLSYHLDIIKYQYLQEWRLFLQVYFSNKKSIDETNIFSKKNRNKNKQ